MARRLYLIKKYDLFPVKEFELLKIENDDEFAAIINYVASKDSGQLCSNKLDLVPSLDHFLPKLKRPDSRTELGKFITVKNNPNFF